MIVTLKSRLTYPVTVPYMSSHLHIPPRGVVENVDDSGFLSVPVGVSVIVPQQAEVKTNKASKAIRKGK